LGVSFELVMCDIELLFFFLAWDYFQGSLFLFLIFDYNSGDEVLLQKVTVKRVV